MLRLCGTQTIETNRLILRRFSLSDAGSAYENWASDAELQDAYGEPAYATVRETTELLEKYMKKYAQNDYFRWAIIERESGSCIGQIAYFLVDKNNHFAEIEYCVGAHFQKNGYATEATRAVITYGFREIQLHKVQICVRPQNAASRRVIEKCGFTYEGTLRDFFFRGGKYEGRMYFSMLDSEFHSSDDASSCT